jgi:hypothetical protein
MKYGDAYYVVCYTIKEIYMCVMILDVGGRIILKWVLDK